MTEIARIIDCQSSPPEEAPGRLTELLAQRFEVDRVSLWLHSPDRSVLFCCDRYDRATDKHDHGVELDITKYRRFSEELQHREIIAAEDLPSLPRPNLFHPAASATSTALYASIVTSKLPAGLICIEHNNRRHWSPDELLLLRTVAALPPALVSAQIHIRGEAKLKQAVALLSGTLESTDEGMAVTGMDRRIVLANQRLLEIFKLKCTNWSALIGTTIRDHLISQVSDQATAIADANLLYTNPEMQAVHIVKLKDGRTLERYSQPHRIDGKIVGRIFSYRDISARIRSEQIRVKLEHQLQQSQKLEALGALSSGIAHDFNNVLNTIACNLEVLRAYQPACHCADEAFSDIDAAIRHASDLVKKILTFGRKQLSEHKLIHLPPVVQEAIKFARAAIPADIKIHAQFQENIPPLLADPAQLHQILLNLCINAWHAIGTSGGRIDIKVRNVSVGPDSLGLSPVLKTGNYIQLSVSDTGCGMDEAVLDHLFEPFFTTKSPGKGTGLGLSVVHGIVHAHGGAINVSSTPGQGTRFDLYFPVLDNPNAETSARG